MADWATLDAWLNLITALAWVLLALHGIARRVRRLERLNQIVLPDPVDQADVDYLASVKRSTYIRLAIKGVLLLGGLIALFHLMGYYLIWRGAVIAILILMSAETVNTDAVRERLALAARARAREGRS